MPPSTRWPDAVLIGLASSMRTASGPALLAARGRISGAPRIGVLVAAAGELAIDKTPAATDRSDLPALGGRVAAGAYGGNAIAGPAGAVAGAVGAGLGTFSTWRIRKLVADTTGLPDPVIAVGEDVVAYGVAAVATRADSDEPDAPVDAEPPPRSLARDAAKGLAAGLAGTAAMTLAQGAEFVLTDAKPSSSPFDVADKLSKKAGRGRIKRKHKPAVNQGMHWLFGTSWGIPYGIVAASSRTAPEISGPALGLFVWGAALAHQPALGIAEVPWKRSPQSLASEALFHVVYGIGAGAALRSLRGRG